MKIFKRGFLLSSLLFTCLAFYSLTGAYADEIEEAPADPTISDICTLSDCSPAKPCAQKDEMCYTVNGAFYCCIEPPGGAEAIGE